VETPINSNPLPTGFARISRDSIAGCEKQHKYADFTLHRLPSSTRVTDSYPSASRGVTWALSAIGRFAASTGNAMQTNEIHLRTAVGGV